MKEKDFSGHIVEFAEQGRVLPAYVLGHKDRRLRVLLPSGREELLPRTRILCLSKQAYRVPNRQEQIRLLEEAHTRRERLKEELDLEELWEVVVDEAEEMTPEELAEVYFGPEPDDDQIAAIIRAVLEDRLYFRFREGRILIHAREEVERLKEARRKEEERLRRREEGAAWLEALLKGETYPVGQEIKEYWLSALKDFYLFGDEAQRARETKELLQRIGANRPGRIFEILKITGVFTEDENVELLRYDIREEFPPELEKEAKEKVAQGFSRKDRRDLTGLFLFTIDGPETRDFDDALHLEKHGDEWLVGIHIADVATFVPPDSRLFKEVLHRGTTLYLPDRIIPMLPKTISEEAASLVAGKERPALSFLVRLSKDGEVQGFEIVRSVVQVKERLTYDQADERLASDETLKTLHQLAQKLFERRLAAGALPVFLPEIIVRVENGEIRLERLEFTPARFLVSEFMILANYIAARFCQERHIPAIYRSQAKPKERMLEGDEQDLLKNFLQLRQLSRGELLLTPEFHHGLGLAVYTTISSPLRRAVDLIMEHQVCHYLETGRPCFSKEELASFLRELAPALEAATAVKNRTTRYWLLKYLKKEIKGKTLDGLVVDIHQRKAKVLLIDYMITVDVPLPPSYTPQVGTALKVVLQRIDPREDTVKAFLAH